MYNIFSFFLSLFDAMDAGETIKTFTDLKSPVR